MITTADAFAGPWALNARGWLWLLVPTGALVVEQELATPTLTPAGVAASTALQLLAVVVWSVTVVGVSRARFGKVVPAASGLLWIGSGATHGLVGGSVAMAAGAEPEWGYRFAFWIIAAITWMPLITYALAQWDHHRVLLAERAQLGEALASAAVRATEDADSRERRLTAAVGDALDPALREIRAQLRENGAQIDPDTAHEIATRLDELARRTSDFVDFRPIEFPAPGRGRVSVAQASVDFEFARPVFAALLSAALIAVPFIAEAYRGGGWHGAGEMALAVAVSTTVLAGAFAILSRFRFGGRERSVLSRFAVVLAGLAGAGTLFALAGPAPSARDIAVLVVFPFVQMLAASLTATAVALWTANVDTEAHVTADRAALVGVLERIRAAEDQTTARLHTLIHGELNGRLAACAMILAFLAEDARTEEARGDVVAKVLDQLDAAARELRTA